MYYPITSCVSFVVEDQKGNIDNVGKPIAADINEDENEFNIEDAATSSGSTTEGRGESTLSCH